MWNLLKSSLFKFLLLGIVGIACEGSNPLSSSSPAVLMESSFEVNGQQSLAPWTRVDTVRQAPIFFSSDVPPGGGLWSLGVKSPGVFQTILKHTVASDKLSDNLKTFRLIVWAKTSSHRYPNLAFDIEALSPSHYRLQGGGRDFTTSWQPDTIETTLSASAYIVNVSLRYWFSTSTDTTEYILFDRVRLEGW